MYNKESYLHLENIHKNIRIDEVRRNSETSYIKNNV